MHFVSEADYLRHVIDRDRYIVAAVVGSIRRTVASRTWLLSGRGPYEWDDDQYRDEFAGALEDIEAAVKPLELVGWDKTDCTITEWRVDVARRAAREMLSQPIRARQMISADLGLPCPVCSSLPAPKMENA